MLRCNFNIIALQLLCSCFTVTKVALKLIRHGCFPVNLLHIFRTPIHKIISAGLLLKRYIPVGIVSSVIDFKICAIIAGIKNYKSIIKKKKRDKIVLIAKSKINNRKILFSQVLIDSKVGCDEFVLINNVLKECDHMKEEIKVQSLSKALAYL